MTLPRALYELPAPAKLNLFLHVIGRRPDGYHLLESVFVLIDWCDTLHLERRADGALHRHDLGDALPADDLCLRAARALQQASGTPCGADIHIHKHLPSGAGMGGGSSDAATVLLGLNRLWGLRWPRDRLLALGQTLGADVPFFIGGHNAFVEGIGERLTPLALAPQRFAVVKPPVGIATQEIFSSPLLVRDTKPVIVAGFPADATSREAFFERLLAQWQQGWGRNDLQPPAQDRCPQVAEAVRWLEERFGNARMTGSGSAVFARLTGADEKDGTTDASSATGSAGSVTGYGELPPGWVGRTCRSLPEHPLRCWCD